MQFVSIHKNKPTECTPQLFKEKSNYCRNLFQAKNEIGESLITKKYEGAEIISDKLGIVKYKTLGCRKLLRQPFLRYKNSVPVIKNNLFPLIFV